MDQTRINDLRIERGLELLRQLAVEKPLYVLLATSILLLWGFEKWVFSVSTWVPLFVSVWATIQYASHKRQIVVEDLNRRWKRAVLESSPMTSVEHCVWVNKLFTEIWPNYFNPMLSARFCSIVEKRLKLRVPSFIERIDIQKFSLGSSPPNLALDGVRWLTVGGQKMMHLGVEWDTCMGIVLLAKLAKLKGTARIIISHLYIKGELQLMPVLDGKAILYSFLAAPVVRIEVSFGSGSNQSVLGSELPGVSSWLGKLLSETLAKTMVEPRRRCFSLPTVKNRRKVVAGVIHVTVVGANHVSCTSFKGSPSKRKQSYRGNGSQEEALVEVQLEQLTRRTDLKQGSSPRWNSTFNMVFHNTSGILKFHLYKCTPGNVKYDYQASCEIKLRYCQDDSTIFWAIGPNNSAIAKQVFGGQEVDMTVPFEGSNSGEISVKLLLQEWQFSDGSQTFHLSSQQSIDGSTSSPVGPATTGRKVYVTVAEAKNLDRKDKSGKINPYVKLHYGKTMLRTRTVSDSMVPVWNKKFEFEELGGGEYLTLRCYSEDTFGDEHLGSARVNLERLADGSVKEEWIPLEKVTSGDIRLLIEAVRVDNNEGSKGFTNNGWIELVLIEAKDLVAADLRGTSDPYVKVQYGNLKKRTKVMFRTLNPHWNQTLEFPDDGRPLTLYVKDYNDILAPSSIGECEIEYERLPLNQTYDKWIPLQGVTKGEIHVRITRKVPELDKRSSLDSDSSIEKAHNITCQMKHMLIKLQALAGDKGVEGLSEAVSELETLEDMQEEYIIQLETEKGLLLNKVAMLEDEMAGSPSSTQSLGTLTRQGKSLPLP